MSPKKKEFQKTKQFENVIEKSPSETKVKKDRNTCVKIVEKSTKNQLKMEPKTIKKPFKN